MQEALDELRARMNGERIDFAELMILGAEAKARRLPPQGDSDKARQARHELAEWIVSGNGPTVDIKAAQEVKYLGLIANYDDE